MLTTSKHETVTIVLAKLRVFWDRSLWLVGHQHIWLHRPWNFKQEAPPNHRQPSSDQHCDISQKTSWASRNVSACNKSWQRSAYRYKRMVRFVPSTEFWSKVV